jgi:hypothetical protein
MQELGPTVGEYETIFRDFQQSVKAARTSADPIQLGVEAVSPYAFNLADIFAWFDSTSLAVMERLALMNRLDTKFVFSVRELPRVLELLMPYYSILTINGTRAHRYDTLYFDRPTLDLYHQHHNGIYARHKVRYRRYVDTGACFFEVKTKKNTGRTVKRRISRPSIEENIDGEAVEFLQREVPGLADRLKPALRVGFTRLTLVNKHALERLTIDLNVRFDRMQEHCSFQNLVIAELKKDRAVSQSPFVDVMRERRLKHGSVSKYCL